MKVLSLSLCFSLWHPLFSFTPFERNRGMYDGSFDLNFNANLGHLSIFHGIPSGWRNDSKLPIYIQNFLSLSFPSRRNRSVLRDLRISSRNKRDLDVERDEILLSKIIVLSKTSPPCHRVELEATNYQCVIVICYVYRRSNVKQSIYRNETSGASFPLEKEKLRLIIILILTSKQNSGYGMLTQSDAYASTTIGGNRM